MITGLTKKQKITLISFDEDGDLIRVQTHNADLKKAAGEVCRAISRILPEDR